MYPADRRNLWDHLDMQCPIIGTCFTLFELRRLARKLLPDAPSVLSDYDLHVRFVKLSRAKNPQSKALQKHLDRKFGGMLRRFAKAKTQKALLELWKEAVAEGDVPGPFWAVVSHPATEVEVLQRVFGEVHMLSHLSGASNRADLKRLTALERSLAATQNALGIARNRTRTLARELADARRERDRAQAAERAAQAELKALREAGPARGDPTIQALLDQIVEMRRMLEPQDSPPACVRPEAEPASCPWICPLACDGPEGQECEACPGAGQDLPCPRLCGKRILYVGGRCRLAPHYRAVVEERGGTFLHHDGGLEDSRAILEPLLCQADVVCCPVDCVSHDACGRLKRLCKRSNKPYVMLRSASVSTLSRTLDALLDPAGPVQAG